MKIALCHHWSISYGGGGEKWLRNLAYWLKRRGHEVAIYALPFRFRGKLQVDEEEFVRGIPYKEAWVHWIDADVSYMVYVPLIKHAMRCRCPKVAGIHSQLFYLRKRPPTKYGIPEISAFYAYKLFGTLDLSAFDAVHIINNAFHVPHRRLYYIPNFIDTSVYAPKKEKNEDFTVLFVGRAVWQKGWDTFLRIASKIRKRIDDIHIWWVGGLCNSSAIEGLGYVNDDEKMAEIYSSAHVMLNLSRFDLFPLSIIESLACNTPVLTTPIKAHKYLYVPLLYAKNTEEFVNKIVWLYKLHKKDEYDDFLTKMRLVERVKKYDVSVILPKIEDMLHEVANTDL